ncbi:helix-turn-helix domain-containing protein [Maricaulis sp.]|uniref:AraC family transcriptional regulator n=1 Tax=Maricaulis sp. TaxID=1486257 RepID=UPI003A90D014
MTSILLISAALSAIIALYLASLRAPRRLAHRFLALVFALFAIQHVLTSLSLTGLIPALAWWRPVLAMALPAAIFLHLRIAARPGESVGWPDLIHIAGPVALALTRLGYPDGPHLDGAIIAALVFYGGLAAITIKAPTPAVRRWKFVVCGWLFAMALTDFLVMLELVGKTDLAHSLALAITMAGFLVFLVYFLLSSLHQGGPSSWIMTRIRRGNTDAETIRARLDTHMAEARPWLDPELTVARLARQLALPQRTVSEAVNDLHGTSVSRWINGWRIAEARRLIQASPERPLVELMLDCGFQTRSNFNKAFKDVTGETPSEWRKRAGASAQS